MIVTVGFSAAELPNVNDNESAPGNPASNPVKPALTRKSKVAAMLETAVK